MAHTIELLNEALTAAKSIGYEIRLEWLSGNAGGVCEIRGQKVLFVDLGLDTFEQFEQVLDAIGHDPAFCSQQLSPALTQRLTTRRAA